MEEGLAESPMARYRRRERGREQNCDGEMEIREAAPEKSPVGMSMPTPTGARKMSGTRKESSEKESRLRRRAARAGGQERVRVDRLECAVDH